MHAYGAEISILTVEYFLKGIRCFEIHLKRHKNSRKNIMIRYPIKTSIMLTCSHSMEMCTTT